MSMPFYVAPEQVMKDRADYARKGIARGRSLAARRSHERLVDRVTQLYADVARVPAG